MWVSTCHGYTIVGAAEGAEVNITGAASHRNQQWTKQLLKPRLPANMCSSYWVRRKMMRSIGHMTCFVNWRSSSHLMERCSGRRRPDGSSLRRTWRKVVNAGPSRMWPPCHCTRCLS
ncbi:hypothetical protein DPMN_067744 [Dreissena polymorpha]|uniref:Uncharacterized protein n=1 Tax=Dreissena polymorpha TaxID=45954 RepID=A0A9D3Z0V7_DREPO|nr:hypothetical protein DPMN_067744 [Dreissena polymorpha]